MAAALGPGGLWDMPLDKPLDGLLDLGTGNQPYDATLLFGEDPDFLLPEFAAGASQVLGGLAAGGANLESAGTGSVSQPQSFTSAMPSSMLTALWPCQPLTPVAESGTLAGFPFDRALAPAASIGSAEREPSAQALLSSVTDPLLIPTYSDHHHQQQQQQQQQQPPLLLSGGSQGSGPSLPQRGRGRPRVDRSQMTAKQLKAIKNAQTANERKKNRMHELEERVADVRADLERERAQQEDGQRSVALLERLLCVKDRMVEILSKQGQEASPSSSLDAPLDAPLTPAHRVHSAASSDSSYELAPAAPPGPLPGPAADPVGRVPQQPALAAGGSAPSGPPGLPSSPTEDSWAHKMPATWEYVDMVREFQRPPISWEKARAPSGSAPVPAAVLREPQELKKLPEITYHYHLDNPVTEACLNLRGICAAASPAVVAEVRSMNPADFLQGWRDYARDARDALEEYDVTGNEAKAVSLLRPHIERLASAGSLCLEGTVGSLDARAIGAWCQAILMNLVVHYNPTCMKQLFLASDENLSEDQTREKYDAVVAAMDMTPSQQERYLELADAYTSFVQQARQHKADALARIAQSAFSSLPASASLGRMVSQYLEAVEGTAALSAYPDAEFIALLELVSGMGKIFRPLQKARGAAMAYPHFCDLLALMDATRRLPPPDQRRQLLADASGDIGESLV
ncbi:hypothetical protein N2152v2_010199 [Parachlorella kessleri]